MKGLIAAAVLAILASRSLSGQGGGTATVTGAVIDRDSGQGVGGAVVLLRGTLLRARTDSRGRFQISAIPAGRYTLTALALGYDGDSLTQVTLRDGEVRELVVALTRAPVALTDVVVTASRAPERGEESGASVSVLSSRELTHRNVTTLDQALAFQPGVTFNAGQMDIRGSTGLARGVGSRVLLMLDGHPILSGDGGEIDFESVPLLDVDRVEVVRGAYSALYGSNALGGVVNVLTTPVDSAPETRVRLHYGAWQQPDRFRFTTARLDEKGIGVQHSQRLGGLGARLFLGREVSDGFRQDDGRSTWLARGKVASSSASSHPWDAYALWARENLGEFFTWRSESEPFLVDSATRNDHEIDYKLLTGATFTPVAGASSLLQVSPYLNYNSVQNDFPSDTISGQNYHRATRLGGTVDLLLRPGSRHALDIGTDIGHTVVTSNFLAGHDINDDAVFAQDAVHLSSRWAASIGARLDYHHASGGKPEWSPSPKVGLTYHPAGWLSARVSLAHGFRSPSAIEQFVSTTQFGVKVIPNPDLKSERAWSTEAGVSSTPVTWLRVDASVFQSRYRELIGPAPAPDSLFVFQFRNVSRARVRGLELSFKTGLTNQLLGLEANYLLLDGKGRDIDTTPYAPLPYRSRHNLTGTLSALRGLLDLDVRFRSRVDTVLVYQLDPRRSITVVDLRVAYRVAGVAIQAKVSNLFQAFYVDVQERNPGAPRQVSLTAFRDF